MKKHCFLLAIIVTLIALVRPPNVTSAIYDVYRSFSDQDWTATLAGTVAIPEGNYTLMNRAPSPFTSVDLTLTMNGNSYPLHHASTDLIYGTGQFIVLASPTTLTFNTANADSTNPADLIFSYGADSQSPPRYGLGSDGNPNFEIAITDEISLLANPNFPLVFGVVPEPSTLSLFFIALGVAAIRKTRRSQVRRCASS
jgi:hypothetical protein